MGPYAGEMYALLSGFFWAIAVCLYKKGGQDMPPLSLNLFKNIFGVVLFTITLLFLHQSLYIDVPVRDYAVLILSGVLGMTLGDTVFFTALKRMGASVWAIVSAFYGPSVILTAYFTLGERIGGFDILGAAIIVCAIILASTSRGEVGRFDKNLAIGVALGLLSLLLMAAGIVMMKPILERTPLWWAIQVRLIGATTSLLILVLLSKSRRRLLEAMLPTPNWKYILPGSLIGPYLALGFWIAGFKYTLAGSAAILTQMNTVFIFVFAALFLKERITRRRALGLALALCGAAIVILF